MSSNDRSRLLLAALAAAAAPLGSAQDFGGANVVSEQVGAARPTADFDATRGDPTMLIDRAYAGMTC